MIGLDKCYGWGIIFVFLMYVSGNYFFEDDGWYEEWILEGFLSL